MKSKYLKPGTLFNVDVRVWKTREAFKAFMASENRLIMTICPQGAGLNQTYFESRSFQSHGYVFRLQGSSAYELVG